MSKGKSYSSGRSEPMSSPERRFVKQAMAAPLLEAETEQGLARAWRDRRDERALHRLTESYVRLVISMAGRFRHYGLPMVDLIQEGNVGLLLAAERFEPEREIRFSTYAGWWVRSCMQDYVLRNWSIVRTGTTSSQKSLFFNLRRLRYRIHGTDANALSAEEVSHIATHLGVPENDVIHMDRRMLGTDKSMQAPIGDEGMAEWGDQLADEAPDPERSASAFIDGARRSDWLKRSLTALSPRERMVIEARKLSDEAETLEAIGQRIGVSKERVRQIETIALAKLKDALERCAPSRDQIKAMLPEA